MFERIEMKKFQEEMIEKYKSYLNNLGITEERADMVAEITQVPDICSSSEVEKRVAAEERWRAALKILNHGNESDRIKSSHLEQIITLRFRAFGVSALWTLQTLDPKSQFVIESIRTPFFEDGYYLAKWCNNEADDKFQYKNIRMWSIVDLNRHPLILEMETSRWQYFYSDIVSLFENVI